MTASWQDGFQSRIENVLVNGDAPGGLTVTRHMGRTTWPTELVSDPADLKTVRFVEHCKEIAAWLRRLKRRVLAFAEAESWNPFNWFVPRQGDGLAIYLLTRSGDMAVRVVNGERRYRITPQGRKTLDAFRFARA